MPIARKHLVDKDSAGFYHCTNRCVRRAFLCGVDKETGMDYSHRKVWLENRIAALCDIFSVEIFAYAIMDNHYHLVLYVDPQLPKTWSDDDVAERWLKVYPSKLDLPENSQQREMKKQAILADKKLLVKYRKRLGDLSWFMRRLNEPLAKRSNQEDYCTGRFWQGRFHSQALLDEAAVLSCMAYVDLNPVRAKIAQKLEDSNHTSIQQRIDDIKTEQDNKAERLEQSLKAIVTDIKKQTLNIKLKNYIQLIEWTAQYIVHPNKAAMPQPIQSTLQNLNLQSHHWLTQIQQMETGYARVIGSIEAIREKAKQLKVKCLKGISAAKLLYEKPG